MAVDISFWQKACYNVANYDIIRITTSILRIDANHIIYKNTSGPSKLENLIITE